MLQGRPDRCGAVVCGGLSQAIEKATAAVLAVVPCGGDRNGAVVTRNPLILALRRLCGGPTKGWRVGVIYYVYRSRPRPSGGRGPASLFQGDEGRRDRWCQGYTVPSLPRPARAPEKYVVIAYLVTFSTYRLSKVAA